MKRIITFILAALMLLGMVACGGTENPPENKAEKIVIYTGGSSEFIWTEGADEQAVWEAVEKKYYEDTGILLDFEVNFMGQDMKSKVSTAVSGGFQVDVLVSHTSGGDGIDDWMFINRNAFFVEDDPGRDEKPSGKKQSFINKFINTVGDEIKRRK